MRIPVMKMEIATRIESCQSARRLKSRKSEEGDHANKKKRVRRLQREEGDLLKNPRLQAMMKEKRLTMIATKKMRRRQQRRLQNEEDDLERLRRS